ncbi:MAG: hypothetical protein U0414_36670 [Polyangiaceae bacterium]
MRTAMRTATLTPLMLALLATGCSKKPTKEQLDAAEALVMEIGWKAADAFDRDPAAKELAANSPKGHALCGSAAPFPDVMPSEGKTARVSPDTFKKTTDANSRYVGWMCMRFEGPEEVSFQYSYAAGSRYRSPARGGKDPGPNGFEVCAEADFVKGGPTTLICVTGYADPAAGHAKANPDVFQASE